MKRSTNDGKKLRELARLCAIQTSYVDVFGERRHAAEDTLRGVLAARGVNLASGLDAAITGRLAKRTDRVLPPTAVAWQSRTACSFGIDTRPSRCVAMLEDGSERALELREIRGNLRVVIPRDIPAGYHFIETTVKGLTTRSRLLVAPMRGYHDGNEPAWGLFAPVYALANHTDVGTFRELCRVMRWGASLGASFFGTLPILATFYEERFEVSPYAPVSRLFWNELFIDEDELPHLAPSIELPSAADSSEWVDYSAAYNRKKRLLRAVCDDFLGSSHPLRDDFAAFASGRPSLQRYATFRAHVSGNPDDLTFHSFVQWVCERQLGKLAGIGCGLYLDYPLGTNPFGFDVADRPHIFTTGASAGAPPDITYREGQSWGFPPIDPDAIAEDPSYFAEAVATHMRHASLLRIDHVMNLHRLYWIPNGMEPRDGAYVRYPAEILYAILLIESHRNRCVVIGEDLGTVPPYVRKELDRHQFRRLFVLQRQLMHERENPPGRIEPSMLASVNNHDMPPFASWWSGADIDERAGLGVYGEEKTNEERKRREEARAQWLEFLQSRGLLQNGVSGGAEVLFASHEFLSRSRAPYVIASLEDLWLETVSQNIPTTTDAQRPNWRHKFRLSTDEIIGSAGLREELASVSQHRRR